ncbi:phosphoinositide phosphatase SAC2-like [Quercus robur]|uniref:phosphoinositide phosphatase SAC2-like n=1 Tax=Quercus robur TaxID=38942 RepID=UPI002163A260|nr:phosphoinositide phosphatase SAC2-like [Quercus robur]
MGSESSESCLQSFRLYETFSNYYIIGRDKKKTFWKVLKIDRLESSELKIYEDSTTYTENECADLLKRLDEGNKKTGGLKLVTACYGIVGFVKFLEPYYMLLITKRRKIGEICGHAIYTITKSKMIPISNPTVRTLIAYSKNENRYQKLLCTVDLTKNFFFSYSYHVMRSLQKNLSEYKTGQCIYNKKCVWNAFLTSEIRNTLKNTLWTVALVHGFFKQVKLSISGREFTLTLIARRSRLYAGTRYLKRGVNKRGRVANDVETEQIVSEDAAKGRMMRISSVVQYRGSVPLIWSQNISGFRKFKPEFSLAPEQHNYEATKLHFENLAKRYGKPIIILSLLKTRGKKRAEKNLSAAYAKAITSIIEDLPEENQLRFCRWDLNTHMYHRRAIQELKQLGEFFANTLDLTGIFYCHVPQKLCLEGFLNLSYFDENNGQFYLKNLNENEDADNLETKVDDGVSSGDVCRKYGVKSTTSQKGILRTNCLDCLDRTNIAQYMYGLVALGRQLHALGFIESPNVDLKNPLAEDLMKVYEAMGDTLALQYGGSPAHNKIFAEIRGQWRPVAGYQDLMKTVQRFYCNAFSDFERQDAINVFLGYFRPQLGKLSLWELDSGQRFNVGRSSTKRSFSDSDIHSRGDSTMTSTDLIHYQPLSKELQGGSMSLPDIPTQPLSDEAQGDDTSILECTPEVSTSIRQLMQVDQSLRSDDNHNVENRDVSNHSSLFDMDWHSSSGNSFVEANDRCPECKDTIDQMKGNFLGEYSMSFLNWVIHGEPLFHGS